ncbi:MAG: sigma-70 family RNA polymerase sigma factor [Candidatus Omnitrophota bacterium]|jgi:RNA polymerase primary sigma factor|nr:MAG: sigma-70 family RNA polymerase sigma factor [Candidatus Omnitrophota bacterium]
MDFTTINRCINSDTPTQPLSTTEEKELMRRCKNGDVVARRRLIECNIRFVVKLALNYRNQGLNLSDLIQEGTLGLIEALEKFDINQNCRLITYASWWIRLYIQRAIEQKSRQINLPINKLDMIRKVKAFEHQFEMTHGRRPTADEVGDNFDIEPQKVVELWEVYITFLNLQGEDEESPGLEKVLVDERSPDARDDIWQMEAANRLFDAMQVLNHREREVLSHRYGLLDGGKKLSLRKVGLKMGMSAEGVRRIEAQAMVKLRRPVILSRMSSLLAN